METKMLVYVDTKNNNNKYYKISLDGTRVDIEYGRVGGHATTLTNNKGKSEFDKKVNEKKRKGYVEVDIAIEEKPAITKDSRLKNAISNTDDQRIQDAIQRLIDLNTHDLFDGKLNISVGLDGLVSTPIGVLTTKTLDQAQIYLDEMKRGDRRHYDDYLKLVPHVFGRYNMHNVIPDPFAEQELLTKLKNSVTEYEKRIAKASKQTVDDSVFENLFHVNIVPVTDAEYDKVVKFYHEGINANHRSAAQKRVKNVFKLVYKPEHEERIANTAEKIGNTQWLWHGTSPQNVLNILRTGLFCPDSKDGRYNITGRMFGDGIYLSDQSTKSLNYSTGFWGGGRAKTAFMFLTDTAMGKTYKPERRGLSEIPGYARKCNFDSIFVSGNSRYVQNNEMIVWNVDQVRLQYLVEFE